MAKLKFFTALILVGLMFFTGMVPATAQEGKNQDATPIEDGPIFAGPPLGSQEQQLEKLAAGREVAACNCGSELRTAEGGGNACSHGGVWSWNYKLTFNIYGGPVTGHGYYRGSIIRWVVPEEDGEGEWQEVGRLRLEYDFSGSYPGGLSGDFTGTSLTGSGHGVFDGYPFTVTVSGSWEDMWRARRGR